MSQLCRSGVRSSNEKSLLLLGLTANKFTRRIHGFGQAGGARGIRTCGMGLGRMHSLRGARQSPAFFEGPVIQPIRKKKSFRVATQWRFSEIKKPPRWGGFLISTDKSAPYLVAGIGFEPMTFRL